MQIAGLEILWRGGLGVSERMMTNPSIAVTNGLLSDLALV
jgi:hypothetical protein